MKKIAVFLLLFLMIIELNVKANGGPVVEVGTADTILTPAKSSNIEVIRETLDFNIIVNETEKSDYISCYSEVQAKYLFFNNSNHSEKVMIAFPYARELVELYDFKIEVLFNSQSLEYKLYDVDDFSGDANFKELVEYIELNADTSIPRTRSSSISTVGIIVFEADFVEIEKSELIVKYLTLPLRSKTKEIVGTEGALSDSEWTPEFAYYLEPAKYWKDFGGIDITINTPDNYHISSSNISDIESIDEKSNSISFDNLPDDVLRFEISKNKESTGNTIPSELGLLLLSLLILAMFSIVVKKRRVK